MSGASRTWQQLLPLAAFDPGPLASLDELLARPAIAQAIERSENEGRYPDDVIAAVQALGVAEVFVGWGTPARATCWHLNALGVLAAQTSGSVAITLGISALALLPAYLAASAAQLERLKERVEGGAVAAMLLSELDAGSNLLSIRSAADRSTQGYVVTGEKQLINMVRRADLLMTLVRTSPPTAGLGAAAGLSLLWIDRDDSVENLPRWSTSPVPAADIGGVRFNKTHVAADNLLGEEGEGFSLVQKSLSLSRGGISSFAVGTSNRALGIALQYARERMLYGAPILKLDAIADHLLKMAAWNLAATALSLKACAAVNVYGGRAAHHTAVAKLACCDLAERAVAEGRAILGARSLLTTLPYQQLSRDVSLYGIFDGTRHVMLDQIKWRLRQLSTRASDSGDTDTGAEIYRTAAEALPVVVRRRGRAWLPRPSAVVSRLANGSSFDLQPLMECSLALDELARRIDPGTWKGQSVSFALAECMAHLEAAIAVAELADPNHRAALGARPIEGTVGPMSFAALGEFAIAAIVARLLGDLRRIALGAGIEPTWDRAERVAAMVEVSQGSRLREALRDSD